MSINVYGTHERGLVIIDITMVCDISIKKKYLCCVFFFSKTMDGLTNRINEETYVTEGNPTF